MSVIGVLGRHAVLAGSRLMYLTMAGDADEPRALRGLIEDVRVLADDALRGVPGFSARSWTLLLLSIGLFRSRVVPRWIPALLWAFLVIEFVGTALSDIRDVRRRAEPR